MVTEKIKSSSDEIGVCWEGSGGRWLFHRDWDEGGVFGGVDDDKGLQVTIS